MAICWWLALAPIACDGKGGDSSGEADADTDTDSDTDTDTDTDSDTDTDTDTDSDTDTQPVKDPETICEPDAWDVDTSTAGTWTADTIQLELLGALDETANTPFDTLIDGDCLGAYARVTLFNYSEISSSTSVHFCSLYYDLEGHAPSKSYAAPDYFLGWFLGDAVDGVEDDCDTMSAVFGHEILSSDFGAPFRLLGIAVLPMSNVDTDTLTDWEDYWEGSLEAKTGLSWTDVSSMSAAVAIDIPEFGSTPTPMDLLLAYELNPLSLELVVDSGGDVPYVDIGSVATLPTAYYQTIPMYILGTGF